METTREMTADKWFATAHHLAQHCPFTCNGAAGPFYISINGALANKSQKEHHIDPVSVLEVLAKGYPFADRTLISGVQRSPWLAVPNGSNQWAYADIPDHGNAQVALDEAAKELRLRLIKELLGYLIGHNHVGILLSGGLDSRVVAGILRTVQLSGEFAGQVTALTWGLPETRDVVYAREIAERYGWEWRHFLLGPEQLRTNIRITADMGAEFAPFHLHALSEVAKCKDLDAIIAGSYGDSIGRAEYSGARLLNLAPFIPTRLDPFGLIRPEVLETYQTSINDDIYGYRTRIPRSQEFQYREIEQQMHYMRRRNQACMSHVAEVIPLYQMFTAPNTFGFMWGLDPHTRNDQHYQKLLPLLPGKVCDIPWARTGLPLEKQQGNTDSLARLHHQYGIWLRQDLHDEIHALIFNGSLQALNIFNESSLRWLMHLWPKSKTHSINRLDEIIAWMASLSIFTSQYRVQGIESILKRRSINLTPLFGLVRAKTYLSAREKFRT